MTPPDAPTSDAPRPDSAVVTGAGGWLGQNLVRALAPERTRVRCLVHDAGDAPLLELAGANVEVVIGDIRDPAALDTLFDGVGPATVFHSAGVIHPARVRDFFDVNVAGTQLALDRARRASAARFVHVSSNSPFGANPTPLDRFDQDSEPHPYMGYGASKLEAEQLVLRADGSGDLPATIVRPPWFYGPFQPERQTTWFRAVAKGRFPMLGDGSQQRSMVYTGNLVDGLLRAEVAAAAPGRAWWIADAEPYPLAEILATVRRALEAEGVTVSGGQPRLPRLAGVVAEKLDGFIQGRGRYQQALHVLGELKDTIACDISASRKELGYEPEVSLFEGMRASIRWCLDRGYQL
jgi:nucleoside-diphosphate-sugar epimerase